MASRMTTLQRAVTTLVFLLPVAGVSACQTSPGDARPAGPVVASSTGAVAAVGSGGANLNASRVKGYESMRELAKDSTAIVLATAGDTPVVQMVGKIPFTVTPVTVTQSFRGPAPGTVLKVRQLGDVTMAQVDIGGGFGPHLKPGEQYILFLTPFYFTRGVSTGQHNITGSAGGFRYNADGTADRMDPESIRLPEKITAKTVQQLIADPGDAATWQLKPGHSLQGPSTTFTALVTRARCNGGVTGQILPPEVSATESEVVVTFFVAAQQKTLAECPGNDQVPYEVVLDEPLQGRALMDGECLGGKAATLDGCTRFKP